MRVRSERLLDDFARLHEALRGEKERLERIHGELDHTYFRYRQLFDLAPAGFLTLDENDIVQEINRAGAALLALDRARPPHFTQFVDAEDRGRYEQHCAQARADGLAVACEVRLRSCDGDVFYARLDSKIYLEMKGFASRHLMVISDISERKRVEQTLHEAKELAEATLSSISDGVITADADGRITGLNAIAEALTGWPSEQAQGEHVDTVLQLLEEDSGTPLGSRITLEHGEQPVPLAPENGYVTLIGRTNQRRIVRGSVAPIRSRVGTVVGMIVTFADATESRRLMREAVYHASHDALTGLMNRREFERRMDRAVRQFDHGGGEHVLCFLDLDHFKLVNDVAGHQAGDELLKHVAAAVVGLVRGRDAVARLGGDEFAILLENCSLDKAVAIAEVIGRGFRHRPFLWDGRRFEISVSIGLAAITAGCTGWQQVLSQADTACYAAKASGRDRLEVNGCGEREKRSTGDTIRPDHLRDALSSGRFSFVCQPVFSVQAAAVAVFHEVLLRLPGRRETMHLPAAFLPLAERYGLMCAIDRWVLRTIFCRGIGLTIGAEPQGISVNISGQSLNDPSLLPFVQRELALSGFPRERLCFEITEGAAIHNLDDARAFMQEMRGEGCRIALDDFGKGLSSFSYLKRFPVDLIKIDAEFVRNLRVDRFDRSVVAAIVHVARDLGIRTVGEGVETTSVLPILLDLGVDYAQGYALGIPVPLDEATRGRIAPQDPVGSPDAAAAPLAALSSRPAKRVIAPADKP